MTLTAHTPGPWRADPDDRDGMEWNIHIVQTASPDQRICFMTSNGPVEANARLIAAAPKMLEALRTIIYASDKCEGHRNCGHDMVGWKLAREVISEIDGEDSS
jgi:hypothetical protein